MKTLPLLIAAGFVWPLWISAAPPETPAPVGPALPKDQPSPPKTSREVEILAAAVKIGQEWQKHLQAGDIKTGMKLWGYTAFDGAKPEELEKAIASQGALKSTEVLMDRCLVEFQGGPDQGGEPRDTYVTLRWFSQYDKGPRREALILHEPAKNGKGLKITGLRREELPAGKQGGFELAADLGQLVLLKFHGAPRERWAPYEHEARAFASQLQVTLPAIPEAAGENGPQSLVNFLMSDLTAPLQKLGEAGGSGEAKAILNAFALLMTYSPGDETSTRLAVFAGEEAAKAKLPKDLWTPLIRAVTEKKPAADVNETLQTLIASVSAHLGKEHAASVLKGEIRETLDMAFKNMARLPTYRVHAEITAADARKSFMDAALGPGAMDLTLVGFDGQKQRRVVTQNGFFLSQDDGKTWSADPDHEIATGLCRTLQHPVEPGERITDKFTFVLTGKETIDSEELFKFVGTSTTDQPPRTYWVLVSKAGPVVRRAKLVMNFGNLEADTLLIYTKLGKPVEIVDPSPVK